MKNKSQNIKNITLLVASLLIAAMTVPVCAQTLTDYYCSTFSVDSWGCPNTDLQAECEACLCTYVRYDSPVTLCRPKKGYTCTYGPGPDIHFKEFIHCCAWDPFYSMCYCPPPSDNEQYITGSTGSEACVL
jgi:hypothetical protein